MSHLSPPLRLCPAPLPCSRSLARPPSRRHAPPGVTQEETENVVVNAPWRAESIDVPLRERADEETPSPGAKRSRIFRARRGSPFRIWGRPDAGSIRGLRRSNHPRPAVREGAGRRLSDASVISLSPSPRVDLFDLNRADPARSQGTLSARQRRRHHRYIPNQPDLNDFEGLIESLSHADGGAGGHSSDGHIPAPRASRCAVGYYRSIRVVDLARPARERQ